jgi:hypothetical protein
MMVDAYTCTGCGNNRAYCICDPVEVAYRGWHDPPSANGDQPEESDWAPIDLGAIATQMRQGNYHPIIPTILAVEEALPLIYPGRINQLFGESATGKSWIALAALHHVVTGGRHGMLVDYEDAPTTTTERLVNAGFTDQEIALIDYRNPSTGLGHGLDELAGCTTDYGIIIFDSTGEALAAGKVGNDDDEIASWFQNKVKPYTRLAGDPAVLLLDHVPKDPNAPKLYAIMSQRKRAAVTGAAYRVDVITPFARGRNGKLKLTVAKDRLGTRPMGTTAAIVDITAGDDGTLELRFHLSDAQIAAERGEKWRPTIYMERISDWLHFNPASSKREIIRGTSGKDEVLVLALETLVDEAWVTVDNGPRGAHLHTNRCRFSATEDPQTPDPATVSPTVSHRTPAYGGDNPATVGPPLQGGATVRSQGDGREDDRPTLEPQDDLF